MKTVGKLACNKISRKRSCLTILNMFGEIEKTCSKYINIGKNMNELKSKKSHKWKWHKGYVNEHILIGFNSRMKMIRNGLIAHLK